MRVIAGIAIAVGVMVALVPEGLLPTVTLSLARGAQRMATCNALVRRLDSVETMGSTTFICTDKNGTLTRKEMSVVEVWTPEGTASVVGHGYAPTARIDVPAEETARPLLRRLPFDSHRRRMSVVAGDRVYVKGAPDSVLELTSAGDGAVRAVTEMAARGLRVLAVAQRTATVADGEVPPSEVEQDLELLGRVGLDVPTCPRTMPRSASWSTGTEW